MLPFANVQFNDGICKVILIVLAPQLKLVRHYKSVPAVTGTTHGMLQGELCLYQIYTTVQLTKTNQSNIHNTHFCNYYLLLLLTSNSAVLMQGLWYQLCAHTCTHTQLKYAAATCICNTTRPCYSPSHRVFREAVHSTKRDSKLDMIQIIQMCTSYSKNSTNAFHEMITHKQH
jgi:hypothetical protein